MIVTIDASFLIDQVVAISPHQRKRIVRGVAQTALLQFLTERAAEGQAVGPIRIVIGNKDCVAAEAVTVGMFLSLVLPGLLQVSGTES